MALAAAFERRGTYLIGDGLTLQTLYLVDPELAKSRLRHGMPRKRTNRGSSSNKRNGQWTCEEAPLGGLGRCLARKENVGRPGV